MKTDIIEFAEDGFGVHDTHFRLMVRTIHGHMVERVVTIHVDSDWQKLTMT